MRMYDCIFTSHCTRNTCDLACSVHAEISYWMERCNIHMDNPVLLSSDDAINRAVMLIESHTGKTVSVSSKDTVFTGDLLSYVAICLHGTGTAFTNGIYKLNFSEYIDEIKRSWQTRDEPESLEFMRIWANTESYLIITGLDYVKFGDFESQTMLQLLQNRRSPNKTTFVVIPEKNSLVGSNTSGFFTQLMDQLNEVAV